MSGLGFRKCPVGGAKELDLGLRLGVSLVADGSGGVGLLGGLGGLGCRALLTHRLHSSCFLGLPYKL